MVLAADPGTGRCSPDQCGWKGGREGLELPRPQDGGTGEAGNGPGAQAHRLAGVCSGSCGGGDAGAAEYVVAELKQREIENITEENRENEKRKSEDDFSLWVFLILAIVFWPGAIVYIIMKKKKFMSRFS